MSLRQTETACVLSTATISIVFTVSKVHRHVYRSLYIKSHLSTYIQSCNPIVQIDLIEYSSRFGIQLRLTL